MAQRARKQIGGGPHGKRRTARCLAILVIVGPCPPFSAVASGAAPSSAAPVTPAAPDAALPRAASAATVTPAAPDAALPRAAPDATVTVAPPPRTLTTAPVAIAVAGGADTLYLPVALTWRLRPGLELMVDGAFTRGDWYGCASRSTGGWLSAGVVLLPARGAGLFLAPKVTGRLFDTTGGRATGWFGCSTDEAAAIPGRDGEIGIGVDAGWRFVVGRLVLEPRLGVGAAVCVHCVGGSAFFVGPVLLGGQRTPRTTRPVLTLNLELLRVGIRF